MKSHQNEKLISDMENSIFILEHLSLALNIIVKQMKNEGTFEQRHTLIHLEEELRCLALQVGQLRRSIQSLEKNVV